MNGPVRLSYFASVSAIILCCGLIWALIQIIFIIRLCVCNTSSSFRTSYMKIQFLVLNVGHIMKVFGGELLLKLQIKHSLIASISEK